MLDLQSLLEPVTPEAPAGANLEDSDAYLELERALLGKPERQFGETLIPAEEPEWPAVIERSVALFASSKDLRVATHLVRALLAVEGFAGFAEGLTLVRALIDNYWAVLHPQLEGSDGDPTARVSAVWSLTHRDMLKALRAAPLVRSRAFGVMTLRSFVLGGAQPGDAATAAESALRDMPIDDVAKAFAAVDKCNEEARALEALWQSHVGSGEPDFADLMRVLAQASKILKARVDEGRAVAQEPSDASAHGGGQTGSGGAPLSAAAPRSPGEFRSREDVVRALDAICAYYARNEPSSPVPLLLQRCKRLVTMSFMDIVKDMVPDGVSTIQTIAGKVDD